MPATEKQIEANRRNSQRSTGPKTAEGKERSRQNAVTHGLTAETLTVVDGEDHADFDARLDRWSRDLGARDPFEAAAIRRSAAFSWKLERLDRHEAEASERRARAQAEVDLAAHRLKVEGLRGRLLPAMAEARNAGLDPAPAAMLVRDVESTADGCRWLLECWGRVRRALAREISWTHTEEMAIVRLCGHGPGELDSPEALDLLVAARVYISPGADLNADRWDAGPYAIAAERDALASALARRPKGYRDSRAVLEAAMEKAVARLAVILELRERDGDDWDASASARLASFDPGDDSERLRRYETTAYLGMLRSMDAVWKHRLRGAKLEKGTRRFEEGPAVVAPLRNEANSDAMSEEPSSGLAQPRDGSGAGDDGPRPVLGERVRAAGVRGPDADPHESKAPHPASPPSPGVPGEGRLAQAVDRSGAGDDGPRPVLGERVRAAGVRGPGTDQVELQTDLDPSLTLRAQKDQGPHPASPPSPGVPGEGRLAQPCDGSEAFSSLRNEPNPAAPTDAFFGCPAILDHDLLQSGPPE